MCQTHFSSVAYIRNQKCAALHTVLECFLCAFVTFASNGRCLHISIHVNLFYIIIPISGIYLICQLFGLGKMVVAVLVIGNKSYNVSPLSKATVAGIAVGQASVASIQSIVNGFIYYRIGFPAGLYRETANTYIQQGRRIFRPVSFGRVKKSKVVIGDIGVGRVQRIVRLVGYYKICITWQAMLVIVRTVTEQK